MHMDTIAQRLAMYDRALATDEVAKLLKMRPWTVRQWIRSRRLVAYKVSNQWRIDPQDALVFWERRRAGK
jgi:excisionase family DNA binding protein